MMRVRKIFDYGGYAMSLEEMIDELKTSMSFEDFESTIRTALDWHD